MVAGAGAGAGAVVALCGPPKLNPVVGVAEDATAEAPNNPLVPVDVD